VIVAICACWSANASINNHHAAINFSADYIRNHRPHGLPIAEECRLMGIARSTYYDAPAVRAGDVELLNAITAICNEFEAYGWRRVQAALRHRGVIANHKRIKRLMREHDRQPHRRRRYIITTDSDHDQLIFPDRSKDIILDGPDQLWVADLTYVANIGSFAYVAITAIAREHSCMLPFLNG